MAIVNNRPGMWGLKSVVHQSPPNLLGGWHDSYFHGNRCHRTCECGHWQPTLEKGESYLQSKAMSHLLFSSVKFWRKGGVSWICATDL